MWAVTVEGSESIEAKVGKVAFSEKIFQKGQILCKLYNS